MRTDSVVAALGACRERLEQLSLAYSTRLEDAAVDAALACPRLVALDVSGCVQLTDAAVTRALRRSEPAPIQTLSASSLPKVSARTAAALEQKQRMAALEGAAGAPPPPSGSAAAITAMITENLATVAALSTVRFGASTVRLAEPSAAGSVASASLQGSVEAE